jgi:flavin-dependent dehydrogenase
LNNSNGETEMDYDVITVGGPVAASILAALLGNKGCRVLLLEKA